MRKLLAVLIAAPVFIVVFLIDSTVNRDKVMKATDLY